LFKTADVERNTLNNIWGNALSDDVIGNGLFAITAAFLAVAYQYWQFRRQLKKSHEDAVITNLISYRFVLLGDRQNDPEPTMRFNAALSSIPVYFSHNKDCIDKYRSIGDGFTAEKYYALIISLMRDVPLGTAAIDKHLLESVPRVTPKAH
jgi:hypothetical protein